MTDYVLDIETTTDWSTIRLVGLTTLSPSYYWHFTQPVDLAKFLLAMDEDDVVFTWNGEAFDWPLLENLWSIRREDFKFQSVDGLMLSKMLHDRHSHSLDSWGKELGSPKLEVDYDNAPISELQTYLEQDLKLTGKIIEKFKREAVDLQCNTSLKWDLKHALRVETGVRQMMNAQHLRGHPFDFQAAIDLVDQLDREMSNIISICEPHMPVGPIPESQLDHPPKVQFKKDGTHSAALVKYALRNNLRLDGKRAESLCGAKSWSLPLTEAVHKTRKILISEQNRMRDYAMASGWVPTMWNENSKGEQTSPRLLSRETKDPCPNLFLIFPKVVLDGLRMYNTAKSRRTMLLPFEGDKTGLLNQVEDGIIHHDADTMGTPTGRFRHRTIVNVPRVTSPYGLEVRSLFIPFRGHKQVGWDATSLEGMMEAHYVKMIGDPDCIAYADEMLDGDIHTKNQIALGLDSRDQAKKLKYMMTYGAGYKKVAADMGWAEAQAKRVVTNFWSANKPLVKLMYALKEEWDELGQEYLVGLDGRLMRTRNEYSLLNTKLQGAGAILMKHAMLLAEKRILRACPGACALIRYHDEEQWSVPDHEHMPHRVGEIGVQSITDAAKYLKVLVPVTGEYKVGNNWAECH